MVERWWRMGNEVSRVGGGWRRRFPLVVWANARPGFVLALTSVLPLETSKQRTQGLGFFFVLFLELIGDNEGDLFRDKECMVRLRALC